MFARLFPKTERDQFCPRDLVFPLNEVDLGIAPSFNIVEVSYGCQLSDLPEVTSNDLLQIRETGRRPEGPCEKGWELAPNPPALEWSSWERGHMLILFMFLFPGMVNFDSVTAND